MTAVKTTVHLSSTTNPAAADRPIAFSAVVKAEGGTEPQGRVKLMEGKKMLTEASLSSGHGELRLVGLKAGTHVLTAAYDGDGEHQPSVSSRLKEIVK